MLARPNAAMMGSPDTYLNMNFAREVFSIREIANSLADVSKWVHLQTAAI